MARRPIDPANLQKVLQRLERAEQNITRAAREEVERSAINIADLARQLAPVGETGDLRASIRYRLETRIGRMGSRLAATFGAEIGAYVPYAVFVEFGTRHRPARPFLFPALEYEHPIFLRTLNERISQELRKVRRHL